MKACPICAELSGQSHSRLALALTRRRVLRAMISESANFVMIPSLGPLVYGHALIVTRTHEPNLILFTDRHELWCELEQVLSRFEKIIQFRHKPDALLLFEHGTIATTNRLCSTSHAHLHVLPLQEPFIQDTLILCAKRAEMVDLKSLPNACRSAGDFVYATAFKMGQIRSPLTFLVANDLPSQFMRKMVANAIGLSTWDWRSNPNLTQIESLIDDGLVTVTEDPSSPGHSNQRTLHPL
jgi:diadenosine tetraphosphate (Ap4A) HIT family hydrolase